MSDSNDRQRTVNVNEMLANMASCYQHIPKLTEMSGKGYVTPLRTASLMVERALESLKISARPRFCHGYGVGHIWLVDGEAKARLNDEFEKECSAHPNRRSIIDRRREESEKYGDYRLLLGDRS